MNAKKLEIVADPNEPIIATRRVVDAPRALVFDAFTRPEYIRRWIGPSSLQWIVCDSDLRVGGMYRWLQRAPNGQEYGFYGEFKQLDPPHKLVQTFVFDLMPEDAAVETLTLEEHDGKTTILTRTEHRTIEARDGHLESGDMEAGMTESYARLDELLASLKEGSKDSAGEVSPFSISRELNAPRSLVWAAHTQVERLTRWAGPEGTEILHAHMDLRVEGVYHYGIRTPDGDEIWGKQTFREITPIERLVFIQSFSDPAGGVTRHPGSPSWPLEMLATTTFEDIGSWRTRLTVTWVPHGASADEIRTFDRARQRMHEEFGASFERLAAYLRSPT